MRAKKIVCIIFIFVLTGFSRVGLAQDKVSEKTELAELKQQMAEMKRQMSEMERKNRKAQPG